MYYPFKTYLFSVIEMVYNDFPCTSRFADHSRDNNIPLQSCKQQTLRNMWGKCYFINYLHIFVNSFLYSYIVFRCSIENTSTAIIAMNYMYAHDRYTLKPGEITEEDTVEVCYIV